MASAGREDEGVGWWAAWWYTEMMVLAVLVDGGRSVETFLEFLDGTMGVRFRVGVDRWR